MWNEGSQFVKLSTFVKTHYCSNKQLIVHWRVDHNILVMKNEIVCNQFV